MKVNEDGCRGAPVVSESSALRSCVSNVILGIIIMLLEHIVFGNKKSDEDTRRVSSWVKYCFV